MGSKGKGCRPSRFPAEWEMDKKCTGSKDFLGQITN